jgi:hypothetical protein
MHDYMQLRNFLKKNAFVNLTDFAKDVFPPTSISTTNLKMDGL